MEFGALSKTHMRLILESRKVFVHLMTVLTGQQMFGANRIINNFTIHTIHTFCSDAACSQITEEVWYFKK